MPMSSSTLAPCPPTQGQAAPLLNGSGLMLAALLLAIVASLSIAIPQAVEKWAAHNPQRRYRQAQGLRRKWIRRVR